MLVNPFNRFRSANPSNAAPATSLTEIGTRTLLREYTIDKSKIDEEKRTVELSFSSEAEVPRWFDEIEVLDHSTGAADLTRLNGGANLLFNHNPSDPLGVVEEARIDSDRRGRAVVRFGNSARAEEVWKDVKDGILRNVSVGYRIHALEMKEKRDGGQTVYLVTRWEPFEVSIVTIPADPSVGVSRQASNPNPTPTQQPSHTRSLMTRNQIIDGLRARGIQFDNNASDADLAELLHRSFTENPQPTPGRVTVTHETQSRSADQERDRVRQITAAGRDFNVREIADKAIEDGITLEEFRGLALTEMNKRTTAIRESHQGIGMSEDEVERFSMLRLISSLSDPQNNRLRNEASFEYSAIEAAAEKFKGRKTRGVLIPSDVLNRPLYGKRDIVSIKAGSGYTGDAGNTVATTLLTGSFIEMLRNQTTLMRLATVLTGLEGDIDIPKQTGQAAAAWIGEDGDAPGTDVNFDLASMEPHTVAAYSQITRKTLKQSSLDVEGFVRADIAAAISEAIDKAGFYGDGTGNQPVGIVYSNPNAVNFAGVQPTWGEIVDMETALGEANINAESSAYVGRAGFRGHAKKTVKFAGTGETIWERGNTVNGYKCEITNQITAGDLFFGDFRQFIIALWGGLDLLVDPYTDSRKGRLNISAFQDVDFLVRRSAAFSFGKKPAGS
jgi:HK97 family phage major capsid protein/HK97 family phage prohead protease